MHLAIQHLNILFVLPVSKLFFFSFQIENTILVKYNPLWLACKSLGCRNSEVKYRSVSLTMKCWLSFQTSSTYYRRFSLVKIQTKLKSWLITVLKNSRLVRPILLKLVTLQVGFQIHKKKNKQSKKQQQRKKQKMKQKHQCSTNNLLEECWENRFIW